MESETIAYKIIESPVGQFVAGVTTKGCCLFEFGDRGGMERIRARMAKRYNAELIEGNNGLLDEIEKQSNEYFSGSRREFDLPIDQKGTVFEKSVWNALMEIPYGTTCSYGEIAARLGKPGAARAVGRANCLNYIPIIIPCHRVIEANGELRGYGGGLWRKRFLLELEGAIPKPMFA
jgi:O-6-methylguanine DNA methyltransferase